MSRFLIISGTVLLCLLAWNGPLRTARLSSKNANGPSTATQLARRTLMPLQQQAQAADPGSTASLITAAQTASIPSHAAEATQNTVARPMISTERSAPAGLVERPLPQCSVVFFHHLEKTGGTTLRSVLQRHAQFGEFDFVSFVNRFDKLQLQMVLHRIHTLIETPGGLDNLRLAVEIHIGGHLSHPYFTMYTLPDLLMLRSQLRARGCQCNLVTLLRHPLLHHLSWHYVRLAHCPPVRQPFAACTRARERARGRSAHHRASD